MGSARELIKLLVKARKVMRLYDSENEIVHRLEDSLAAAASVHLDTYGPCDLRVFESRLEVAGSVVYSSEERVDNLALLLHRDGVRQLTLLPGLDRDELHDLLGAINRVGQVANADEDLVTILWERDFEHVRYLAVEEIGERDGGLSVAEQLASSRTGDGVSAPGVDLSDLEQPVAHLPIESCMLTEEEAARLQEELGLLDEGTEATTAVEIAIDLTLLSEEEGANEALAGAVVATLDRVVEIGALDNMIEAVGILDEMAETDLASSAGVTRLRDRVLGELAQPSRVTAVLAEADRRGVQVGLLRYFLLRLGEPALPAVVAALPGLASEELRDVAAEVIQASGAPAIRYVVEHLAGDGARDERFVRAVLHLLRSTHGDEGVPIVEQLLTVGDPTVRRQAARNLGPWREGPAGDLWLRLLDDDDEQMRILAITALVRGEHASLAQHLLDRASDEDRARRSPEELEHLMIGIARLAGEQVLPWFSRLLTATPGGFLARRRDRELLRTAAVGLRAVGTPAARDLLEEHSRKGGRHLRAACRQALAAKEPEVAP